MHDRRCVDISTQWLPWKRDRRNTEVQFWAFTMQVHYVLGFARPLPQSVLDPYQAAHEKLPVSTRWHSAGNSSIGELGTRSFVPLMQHLCRCNFFTCASKITWGLFFRSVAQPFHQYSCRYMRQVQVHYFYVFVSDFHSLHYKAVTKRAFWPFGSRHVSIHKISYLVVEI